MNLMPLFLNLLVFAGTNLLVAAGTKGTSSSIIHPKIHHDFAYEHTAPGIRLGTASDYTDFFVVDLEEKEAIQAGFHLRLKRVTMNGNTYPVHFITRELPPHVGKFLLNFTEKDYGQKFVKPKDLEGFQLHIVYEFGKDLDRYSYDDAIVLTNEKKEKEVTIKIPSNGKAATEMEKDILKGIFIGGDIFRVEAHTGKDAKIEFIEKLSRGTMHFTVDYYSNFPGQKGQLRDIQLDSTNRKVNHISKSKSTFSINRTDWDIDDIEQLRTVHFPIHFTLAGKKSVRTFSLADMTTDQLKQIFVGGEAIIVLSAKEGEQCLVKDVKKSAVTVPMPKSTLETGMDKLKSAFGI